MNVIFLGPPGAGKGTIAQEVCKHYNIPQISTGDILRKSIKEGTDIGLIAKQYIDQGNLVPDEVVIEIAKERLKQPDCKNGYILDGFPRTIEQAEALRSFADIDFVLNLDVEDGVIVERLGGRRVCPACHAVYHTKYMDSDKCNKCGTQVVQRKDDAKATVLERLKVYSKQTAPLIDYYEKAKKLVTVDGARSIELVLKDVLKVFERFND